VVEWYVDDQELPAHTGTVEGTEGAYSFSTLPAALPARGQVWSFRVIPHDGAQSGPAADSRNPADAAGGSPRTVAIVNTPPSILSAEVAPANSGSNWHTDTYTAGNITHNDPDGDPVVIHYQWYSGGTDRIEAYPVPGATGATFRPADHALTRSTPPAAPSASPSAPNRDTTPPSRRCRRSRRRISKWLSSACSTTRSGTLRALAAAFPASRSRLCPKDSPP
jgi:hypothetical protein